MKRPVGASMRLLGIIVLTLGIFPLVFHSSYLLHIMIYIFIWSGITTAWAYMGRFHLVSLCHGAFIGIPAYTVGILFNYYYLSPWWGMVIGLSLVALLALIIGYACFRFGVTGHYFAITTLVVTELVVVVIIALRDITGGRLGFTLNKIGARSFYEQLVYIQFNSKIIFYYLALLFLLLSLYLWKKIDKNKAQMALKAIADNEVAALCIGIPAIRYKTGITIISSVLSGLGGILYAQYTMYINPITLVGVGPSLEIIFNAILGGMFTLFGPTIGTILITVLQEIIRVYFGVKYMGWSIVGYALGIILIIIFMPKGVYGTVYEKVRRHDSDIACLGAKSPGRLNYTRRQIL